MTGGRDTLIHLWPLEPSPSAPYRPKFTLVGHTANVCCLSVSSKTNTIVSGSWDCTAKIWRGHELLYDLQGHSAAVWSVLTLGDSGENALTAAADNLIIHWRSGKQAKTFKGHTQAVRALVLLPSADDTVFASASNDATIRIWSLKSGATLSVLNGHDSFVYSLAYNPSVGELLSSGEDRTVRIWNPETQELKQTITLPAISIWSVAACPANGDIVAGSSDNLVRIFTRSPERLAAPDALKSFEDSVAASTVSSATVGDVKKSDLPDETRLRQPGNKEGQVIMVKNSQTGAVEAHQWSSGDGKWTMVGTVVDGVGSGRRQLYEGREYDYVFDVDIKDGAPPLKLPYNASGAQMRSMLKPPSAPADSGQSCGQIIHTRSHRSGSLSTSFLIPTSTKSSSSSIRTRAASPSAPPAPVPTPSQERGATDPRALAGGEAVERPPAEWIRSRGQAAIDPLQKDRQTPVRHRSMEATRGARAHPSRRHPFFHTRVTLRWQVLGLC